MNMDDSKYKPRSLLHATLVDIFANELADQVRPDLSELGEALGIIRRVLADLVEADNVDTAKYSEDLDRLKEIEHMVKYS